MGLPMRRNVERALSTPPSSGRKAMDCNILFIYLGDIGY